MISRLSDCCPDSLVIYVCAFERTNPSTVLPGVVSASSSLLLALLPNGLHSGITIHVLDPQCEPQITTSLMGIDLN